MGYATTALEQCALFFNHSPLSYGTCFSVLTADQAICICRTAVSKCKLVADAPRLLSLDDASCEDAEDDPVAEEIAFKAKEKQLMRLLLPALLLVLNLLQRLQVTLTLV